jgi:hypothetical protein
MQTILSTLQIILNLRGISSEKLEIRTLTFHLYFDPKGEVKSQKEQTKETTIVNMAVQYIYLPIRFRERQAT